jgi:hypothetical protein
MRIRLWACLWDTKIRDSHKHATKTCIYERAYETPKQAILISTVKHAAYMSVLILARLWDTKIQDSHKHDKTCMHIWACLWDTKIHDSHKHAKTCIYERAYETPKYGILISTLKHADIWACLYDTKIHDYWTTPKYWRDSHKHAKICIYERAYETPKYGILISTIKHAYTAMSVLMRHQNTGLILISTLLKHAYMSVLMRHQNTRFS